MTRLRKSLRRAWVRTWEQMPAYSNGRLDLGGLGIVVMSRGALQRSSEQHLMLGARLQQREPGFLAGAEDRQAPASVRHLRVI